MQQVGTQQSWTGNRQGVGSCAKALTSARIVFELICRVFTMPVSGSHSSIPSLSSPSLAEQNPAAPFRSATPPPLAPLAKGAPHPALSSADPAKPHRLRPSAAALARMLPRQELARPASAVPPPPAAAASKPPPSAPVSASPTCITAPRTQPAMPSPIPPPPPGRSPPHPQRPATPPLSPPPPRAPSSSFPTPPPPIQRRSSSPTPRRHRVLSSPRDDSSETAASPSHSYSSASSPHSASSSSSCICCGVRRPGSLSPRLEHPSQRPRSTSPTWPREAWPQQAAPVTVVSAAAVGPVTVCFDEEAEADAQAQRVVGCNAR